MGACLTVCSGDGLERFWIGFGDILEMGLCVWFGSRIWDLVVWLGFCLAILAVSPLLRRLRFISALMALFRCRRFNLALRPSFTLLLLVRRYRRFISALFALFSFPAPALSFFDVFARCWDSVAVSASC
jgi:hypothetical protein